jgi:hypothetical protein
MTGGWISTSFVGGFQLSPVRVAAKREIRMVECSGWINGKGTFQWVVFGEIVIESMVSSFCSR